MKKHFLDKYISNNIEDKIKRQEMVTFTKEIINTPLVQKTIADSLDKWSNDWIYKEYLLKALKEHKIEQLPHYSNIAPIFYFLLDQSAPVLKVVSQIGIFPPNEYDPIRLDEMDIKDDYELKAGEFNKLPSFLEHEYQWVFAQNTPEYHKIYQYIYETNSLLFCNDKYQNMIDEFFPEWNKSPTFLNRIFEQFENGKINGIVNADYRDYDRTPTANDFYPNIHEAAVAIDKFLAKNFDFDYESTFLAREVSKNPDNAKNVIVLMKKLMEKNQLNRNVEEENFKISKKIVL